MAVDLSRRLVPDGLWELAAPLLPRFTSRPQSGGTKPVDERAVFAAVVYVLTSGCAGRHLPPTFGVSPATVHRIRGVLTRGLSDGGLPRPHCWAVLPRAARTSDVPVMSAGGSGQFSWARHRGSDGGDMA
ncbi:transposase [Streptomyces sp. NBC_01142]|uniref:transposase n=1 Tax=Streptomyces sp. NBC_01142 TaxID=2975865 RepID=UPI0033900036